MSAKRGALRRRWVRLAASTTLLAAISVPIATAPAAAATLPAGFEDQLIAKVSGPTAIPAALIISRV